MNDEVLTEISFISHSCNFKPVKPKKIITFLTFLLTEKFLKKDFLINIIFINKSDITEMNMTYLKHNYPTDVVCFDFTDEFGVFSGDIYICPEVVEENSVKYKTSKQTEMLRVIIHGVLHLLGYKDKTETGRKEMKIKEDEFINFYFNPS